VASHPIADNIYVDVLRTRAGAKHDAERIVPIRSEKCGWIRQQHHVGYFRVYLHQKLSAISRYHRRTICFLDLCWNHHNLSTVFAHFSARDERKNIAGKFIVCDFSMIYFICIYVFLLGHISNDLLIMMIHILLRNNIKSFILDV